MPYIVEIVFILKIIVIKIHENASFVGSSETEVGVAHGDTVAAEVAAEKDVFLGFRV
ncbi:MAG: hypothetical protein JSW21_00095 [Gammaproteobacteria bacterium]|jgi:hypothetical protein|nr:MAG: hypothetical protein JSW21_00095 [Gammaproteobacteria bacterium]